MKTYKFKTNINCGGCIATVTPYLNSNKAIENWQVDTGDKDKVLTVTTATLSAEQIAQKVKEAGFKATPIQ